MSKARDLYTQISSEHQIWRPGNPEPLKPLLEAANLWRSEGRFFSAAVCMLDATHAAWGTKQVHNCIEQAVSDFETSVDTQPRHSLEGLAALHLWLAQLRYFDPNCAARPRVWLQQELAERLLKFYGDSKERNSYLVTGFVLNTDLDGNWGADYPDFEITPGSQTRCGADLRLSIPSAFTLLVAVNDYLGAHEIAQRCPEAFTSAGLKGWSLAVRGFLSPEQQVECFSAAADAFAQDIMPSPEELQKRKHWDSTNVDLWAKYFRARASVARIPREPSNVVQLLQEASQILIGTESGWVDSQVNRFRLLVSTLLEVLQEANMDSERALRQLKGDQWLHVTPHDPIIEEFVRSAGRALQAFREDAGRAVIDGQLSIPLALLGRIDLIGPDVTRAMAPAIANTAGFRTARQELEEM